jgi:[acyl-carrier-protein] S-malonyltransferase
VSSPHQIAGLLTDQITRSVRWEQSMGRLRQLGCENVLEVGPGKVLAGLHKRIDREMPFKNIGTVEQLKEVLK